jgi:hypothetical protein
MIVNDETIRLLRQFLDACETTWRLKIAMREIAEERGIEDIQAAAINRLAFADFQARSDFELAEFLAAKRRLLNVMNRESSDDLPPEPDRQVN